MALVSAGGMGEAVLGYGGDGIASEVVNTARDGGVFAGLNGEGLVGKEIRLGGGRARQHEDAEGRRGLVNVLMGDQDAGGGDASHRGLVCHRHLMNVRLESSEVIGKAAGRLTNGSAETRSESAETVDQHGERAAVEGERSHASDPGSPDHLVDKAIQCLDEKVFASSYLRFASPRTSSR